MPDPESRTPEYLAAGAAASLPAAALLQDYRRLGNLTQLIEDAPSYDRIGDLKRVARPFDIGVHARAPSEDYGKGLYGVLQRGSVAATGTPVYHGFVVGPNKMIYEGGIPYAHRAKGFSTYSAHAQGRIQQSLMEAREATDLKLQALERKIKRPLTGFSRFRARMAILKDELKPAWQRSGAYRERIQELLDNPDARKRLFLNQELGNERGAVATFKELLKSESSKEIRPTILLRGMENLTPQQKKDLADILSREGMLPYDTKKAFGGAARNIFLPDWMPGFRGKANPAGQVCKTLPGGGHHCASLPALMLQYLGKGGKNAPGKMLPGKLPLLPGVSVVGTLGKDQILKNMAKAFRGRAALGAGAAGLAAAGGYGATRLIRKMLGGEEA